MSLTMAVIGCGKFREGKEGWAVGHAHAKGMREACPDARILGVDPDPENLAAFGKAFDLPGDALFASTQALYAAAPPDVVGIATWPGLHRAQVLEAAARGVRAILCEKPMAMDGSEIDDMVEACARGNVLLGIAHQRMYEGPFVKAREIIRSGRLGSNLVAEARVADGWDILSWTVHWFDMVRFLFEAQPEWVLAGMEVTGARRYHHAVEDASVILAGYPGDRQAVFVTGPPAPLGQGVAVRGSEGMLEIGKPLRLFTAEGLALVPPLDTPGGFVGAYADLTRCLDTGEEPACSARHCALATRVAFAAQESARTRRRVRLPEAPKYAPLEVLAHPAGGITPRTQPFRRALLLADGHHRDPVTGRGGREGLQTALASLGLEVRLVRAEEREPEATDLDGIDVLVLYHTQRTSSPALRALLGDWIAAGRPVAVMHCGLGAYSDWPEWKQWLGLHWVWAGETGYAEVSGHPHEPCRIEVDQAGRSLGLPWTEGWLPRDEVYVRLHPAGPHTVLAWAHLPDGRFPAAWASDTAPRLAVWGPGHREDIWALDVMRDGLAATLRRVGA